MLRRLAFLLLNFLYVIAGPTTYTYKTIEDLNIQLDVYVPDTPPSDKYPIFFTIHGGGYVLGSKMDAFSAQELNEALTRGWVVVSIDYRLNPGALIDDMIQDVQDAYLWVHAELTNYVPVDLDHITIFGGSAGGGLTLMSGYKLTPRPQAIISFYPYYANFTDVYAYNPNTPVSQTIATEDADLQQLIAEYTANGTSPRGILFANAFHAQKGGWLIVSKDPNEASDQVLAMLKEYSAADNVDSSYPPTYLAHGLNDTLVPYDQSVEMAAILKENNIDYKLDLVPNAKHCFDMGNITTEMWQEHILPAFDFAQQYMNNFDKISI